MCRASVSLAARAVRAKCICFIVPAVCWRLSTFPEAPAVDPFPGSIEIVTNTALELGVVHARGSALQCDTFGRSDHIRGPLPHRVQCCIARARCDIFGYHLQCDLPRRAVPSTFDYGISHSYGRLRLFAACIHHAPLHTLPSCTRCCMIWMNVRCKVAPAVFNVMETLQLLELGWVTRASWSEEPRGAWDGGHHL